MKTNLLDQPLIIKNPSYDKKVLIFDIENTPLLSYNWGIWEQNAVEVKEEWYILCFAYKWLGEKETHIVALPDFKGYKNDKKNDEALVQKLWELFDQASVLIAHNGDQFDIKKANARFLIHGMPPPSPYKTIDTLKIARRHFKLDSNKLDSLGQYLKLGRKLAHTGKHLWFGCMEGDKDSWTLMKKYNVQDVVLLEKVYFKLRGWDTRKVVNMSLVFGRPSTCPKCTSEHIHKKGLDHDGNTAYQRYKCLNCGYNIRGEKERTDKPYV